MEKEKKKDNSAKVATIVGTVLFGIGFILFVIGMGVEYDELMCTTLTGLGAFIGVPGLITMLIGALASYLSNPAQKERREKLRQQLLQQRQARYGDYTYVQPKVSYPCEYCATMIDEDQKKCTSCGAPNRPKTQK